MGFLRDDGQEHSYDHEGFLIGLVRKTGGDYPTFRELGYPSEHVVEKVTHLQVGCTCGWRSQRVIAPLGTTWSPYTVHLDVTFGAGVEDAAAEVFYGVHLVEVDRAQTEAGHRVLTLEHMAAAVAKADAS